MLHTVAGTIGTVCSSTIAFDADQKSGTSRFHFPPSFQVIIESISLACRLGTRVMTQPTQTDIHNSISAYKRIGIIFQFSIKICRFVIQSPGVLLFDCYKS